MNKSTARYRWLQVKTCPFCGSQPTMVPWHGGGPLKRLVHCENEDCAVRPGVCGSTPKKAVELWNLRENDN